MTARSAAPKARTPNARSLYQHVERYLAGCLNDAALEHWQLAIGRAIERGEPFDRVLGQMGQLYVRTFGLPMRGAEREASAGTDAERAAR